MARQTLFLLLTLSLSCNALALNILAIVSLPLRSHYMAFHPLFRELAARGHHVTVMNNFPEKNVPSTMQFVDLSTDANGVDYFTPISYYEDFDSNYLHLYNFFRHLQLGPSATRGDCENLLKNENVQALLVKEVKYDVIFVEMFGGECGMAFAGAMFDAPIIGIASHVMQPDAYYKLGLPFDFSSDAFYFSKGGPNPSLYHRIESVLMDFVSERIYKWYIQFIVYGVFNRYLPDNSLDIEEVGRRRLKMYFSYQHFSLTGARVLAPQVLEIGGIHVGQAKSVPGQIDKFLSSAEHGAIFVSFGSNLKAKDMSENKTQQFLDAFKRVPQKIIWKYENASLPEGYEKVYTSDWLPQLDILCHPKVVGFVSHGGMLSLSEATHCGKPAVVVPFFGDQFSNAAAAEHSGLGRTLYFDKLDGDSLAEAIREITSPRMQQAAKRISKLWHDRPMSVMDSAIYWTEYVARNHDADAPPSLPSKHSMWYERLLLDVTLVLVTIISIPLLILATIFKMIRFVVRLFCGKSNSSEDKMKKKKA